MAGDRAILLDWRLHPGIDSCTEEMIDGTTHRRLVAADGAQFLEKSIEGDLSMADGYAIIESPLPVKDYESTLEVREMGEDSVIVWSSTFAGMALRKVKPRKSSAEFPKLGWMR